MKPVKKEPKSKCYSPYGKAKPHLIAKLGSHCSYCEHGAHPRDLDVEHIYPKFPHKDREEDWDNFLLACSTCNTYKDKYLGHAIQKDLEAQFVWPHKDNTFLAFQYKSTGAVNVATTVQASLVPIVEATRDMIGLMKSPAVAKIYKELSLAYSGAKTRSQLWNNATGILRIYLANPTDSAIKTIVNNAVPQGHFSIWMEVFKNRPEIRRELIRAFKADPNCFHPITTQPLPKGRL